MYPNFCIEYAQILLSISAPVPDLMTHVNPCMNNKISKTLSRLEMFKQQGGKENKYLDNKDKT